MILAWPILIGLALFGWGLIAAAAARRWGGVDLRSAADVLPLGIAIYLAVAGGALAFDLHTRWFTTAMILGGLGATAVSMVARARVASRGRRFGDPFVGSVLITFLLAIALWRAAHFNWNPCDDDAAYLYLARRLTQTADLLDPLNFRRVTSLGGMSSLQSLFLDHMPDSALPLADLFLGPLLVMVQLWRTPSGKWSAWGIAGALVVILFPLNLRVVNTSPALLAVGLALATYRFAMRMRASGDGEGRDGQVPARAHLVLGGSLGIVVAAAGTMRPQFALALVPFAVAAVVVPPIRRSNMYCLIGLSAGGVVGLSGWMVASWRAVGIPMFPVAGGNVDPRWPANGPDKGAPTVLGVLGDLAHILTTPHVGLALVLGGMVTVGIRRSRTSSLDDASARWPARIYLLATGATVLLLTVLGIVWWNSGALLLFPRFWMPIVVATALLPLAVVTRDTRVARRALHQSGAFLVAVAVTAGTGAWYFDVRDFASGLTSGRVLDALAADRNARLEADYDEVSRMITPGSKVLASVDVPSLLLGHGFDVNTLDVLGSTSPKPRLPYFEGAEAKLAWARHQGYDYIVATEPTASTCLFDPERQVKNVARGGVYRAWAPWYLDWFRFLAQVTDASPRMDASATRVGSLIIVQI